jgi:LysM repeat protein
VTKDYVVKAGDTLSRIARDVYGDPTKWTLIHDANRATVKYAGVIKIEQRLKIPKQPTNKKVPPGFEEPPPSSCEGDIQTRLEKLKDLHDKRLIDDKLFLQRQKELVQCI